MRGLKKHIALFILLASTVFAAAQVTVDFNAALYGRSIDGLAYAQLSNSGAQAVNAKLKITIREARQGIVTTIRTMYMPVPVGLSMLGSSNYTRSNFVFAANTTGTTISQTGKLPAGEYEFCFEVTVGEPKTQQVFDVNDFCFESAIEPVAPLLLINPAPDDKICNTRPDFTWQPPVPVMRSTQYRIVVCEKEEKQTDAEAISFNIPLINIAGLFTNTLFYPPKTPDLKKDHKYVWQVTAYQDKTILTKSEIWEFEIKCEEEKKKDDGESFRELKQVPDGSVYYAYGKLRFFFNNPYNEGKLNYSITAISEKLPDVNGLPELKIVNGYNQFEIDLSEIKNIKADKDYLLKVQLADNRVLQMQFVYKEIR